MKCNNVADVHTRSLASSVHHQPSSGGQSISAGDASSNKLAIFEESVRPRGLRPPFDSLIRFARRNRLSYYRNRIECKIAPRNCVFAVSICRLVCRLASSEMWVFSVGKSFRFYYICDSNPKDKLVKKNQLNIRYRVRFIS